MKPRTLEELATAIRGITPERARAGESITGVAVDSRRTRPGDAFFALPGDHSDGRAFVADAFSRGAAVAVVRTGGSVGLEATAPLIQVEDPALALLDLARDERSRLGATVVGITGSTGKTCTKDFTASVLGTRLSVVASPASYNNEVGLPLTLLQAREETDVVVCEMGSRGPGHIRLLCDVARPSIGVVTNVGVAHMELFGSPDVLRDAKAELIESLPADGVAVLNADDHVVRSFAARTEARPLLFGTGSRAEVTARDVRLDPQTGAATFRLVTPEDSAEVALTVPGEHMVPNALAAAGVGRALGIPVADAASSLATARISGGRMEVHLSADGFRVVNDAYNANPTSMAAGLRAARLMAGDGRCIAVLGPMAELGPIADQEHLRVGELIVRLGIHAVVVVGDDARLIAAGAQHEGVEPGQVRVAEGIDEAAEIVRALARPGDLVLVKASRAARLERVVDALLQRADVVNGATA